VIPKLDTVGETMKKMIKSNRLPSEFPSLVDVVFYPGGASSMKGDIIGYSRELDGKVCQIFDGTELPTEEIDIQKRTVEENQPLILKPILEKVIGQKVVFSIDGGDSGGRADQELSAISSFIRFWNMRCFFLPFDAPEDIIWNREFAKTQLESVIVGSSEIDQEIDRIDGCIGKVRFRELAKILYNESTGVQILALQTQFLKVWLKQGDSADIKQVEEIILRIRKCFQPSGS
jgi:hypothetical protein